MFLWYRELLAAPTKDGHNLDDGMELESRTDESATSYPGYAPVM
jgi:hypothetical protein